MALVPVKLKQPKNARHPYESFKITVDSRLPSQKHYVTRPMPVGTEQDGSSFPGAVIAVTYDVWLTKQKDAYRYAIHAHPFREREADEWTECGDMPAGNFDDACRLVHAAALRVLDKALETETERMSIARCTIAEALENIKKE